MQNTIIKEFADNPDVFVAAFDQGGSHGETREWLELYWSSHYLRGNLIWDESGSVGGMLYGQPQTNLPFGRGFIIDPQRNVHIPYFGHQPQMAIAAIYAMLETIAVAEPENGPPPGRLRVDCYPNPFNPGGTIEYTVETPGPVTVQIFDVQGRQVRTLVRQVYMVAGRHTVRWAGKDDTGLALASGTYLVRVDDGGDRGVRRMTLIR